MDFYNLLANSYSAGSPLSALFMIYGVVILLPMLAVVVLLIISQWKIFQKAGQKGWKSIVPIYNLVIMQRIIRKPWWWILLMFIPYVSVVVAFVIFYHLSKVFGKSGWFSVGLIFLPFIFYPILAFGKAQYKNS